MGQRDSTQEAHECLSNEEPHTFVIIPPTSLQKSAPCTKLPEALNDRLPRPCPRSTLKSWLRGFGAGSLAPLGVVGEPLHERAGLWLVLWQPCLSPNQRTSHCRSNLPTISGWLPLSPRSRIHPQWCFRGTVTERWDPEVGAAGLGPHQVGKRT